MDSYINPAQECVHINFTRPAATSDKAGRILDEPINPEFTHHMVAPLNNEDVIFGYKDPSITLDFRANDLRPRLSVSFAERIDISKFAALMPDTELPEVDLETAFHEFLPKSAYDPSEPYQTVGPDPASPEWKPPGKRINSFEVHGKQYEVWSTSLADPAAMALWKNMQIMVLFFVDGALPLDTDEEWSNERWTIHLLYEVTPLEDASVSPYTIAGFATSYRYWIFPTLEILRATSSLPSPPQSSNGDSPSRTPPRLELADGPGQQLFKEQHDPLQAPSRERLSQFLILPHYQRQSLGTRLYETIYGYYLKQPNVYEIPVEDPNEEFDTLRDFSDLAYLRTLPSFKSLSVASSLPPEKTRRNAEIPRDEILGNGADLTALRHETKLVPRQFYRMVELHTLSTIPPNHRNKNRITRKDKASNENDRRYYFWRLALKARIYLQNKDELDLMEDETQDRNEKIDAAVDSQESEYLERLDALEERRNGALGGENGTSERASYSKRKRGRVVTVEDEDEEDGWEDEDDESMTSKRARV